MREGRGGKEGRAKEGRGREREEGERGGGRETGGGVEKEGTLLTY